MEHFDEGMNGRVYETPFGVIKIQKKNSLGHDIQTQKRIHHFAARLVEELNLQVIRVPNVNLANLNAYEMERISTEKIIYLGDPNHGHPITDKLYEQICNDLAILWGHLFDGGFAAWDYELFLQPDGTVALIDFDKFGFHMTTGPVSILLPQTKRGSRSLCCVPDLRYFFQNPCFPHDFVDRLRSLGFEPPADCLPTTKNQA